MALNNLCHNVHIAKFPKDCWFEKGFFGFFTQIQCFDIISIRIWKENIFSSFSRLFVAHLAINELHHAHGQFIVYEPVPFSDFSHAGPILHFLLFFSGFFSQSGNEWTLSCPRRGLESIFFVHLQNVSCQRISMIRFLSKGRTIRVTSLEQLSVAEFSGE